MNFCSTLQQESAKCVFVFHGHITAVRSLSFCPSGLALVSGGIGGLLNIWSLQARKTTKKMSKNNSCHLHSNLSCVYIPGWFSPTDCYRFGFSPQHYLDTRHGCSCLLWEVKGN